MLAQTQGEIHAENANSKEIWPAAGIDHLRMRIAHKAKRGPFGALSSTLYSRPGSMGEVAIRLFVASRLIVKPKSCINRFLEAHRLAAALGIEFESDQSQTACSRGSPTWLRGWCGHSRGTYGSRRQGLIVPSLPR